MAVEIEGVTYYHYSAKASWDGEGTVPNVTATVWDAASGGAQLVVRDPGTEAVVDPITGPRGVWKPYLVNAPISYWDGGSGQRQERISLDNAQAGVRAAEAASAAEAAQVAAEAAQLAAENAVGPTGPEGPPGAPLTILEYDVTTGWPDRGALEGPRWWTVPLEVVTWPGDPAGALPGDYLLVWNQIDPTGA